MNAKRLSWVAGIPLLVALTSPLNSALAQPRSDRSLTTTSDDRDDDPPSPPPGRGDPHGGMRGGGWGHRGEWGMDGGGFWMRGPEMMLMRGEGPLAKQLNLSTDQKKKLRDIGDRMMRQAIRRRSDIELAMLDLRNLLHEDNPDKAGVDRQIDQIASLRAEQAKAAIGARLEARQVLTREQREKLRDWMPPNMPPNPPGERGGSQHGGSR